MESVLASALVIITIIVCLIIEKEPRHLCPRCGHKMYKNKKEKNSLYPNWKCDKCDYEITFSY